MKVAEIQLSYRVKTYSKPRITCSRDAYEILLQNWSQDTINYYESCKVILLNNHMRCLGITNISEGGINETLVDVRKVLQAALLGNASLIILAHNHPSGRTDPSQDDDRLTERIAEACKILCIKLADHIIVTEDSYYSYNDNGKLP